jgi:hypothetical protein
MVAMVTSTACPSGDDDNGDDDTTVDVDAGADIDAGGEGPDAALNVDECAEGTDTCDVDATCTDADPGFTCTCNDGYTGDGETCTDVDECTTGADNCDVNATCTNTSGSFTCECNEGYKGDGVECEDIDECPEGDDPCDEHAICENVEGGFTCTCESGYTGDGFTCANIDECTLGTDTCDDDALCTDTDGAFACECNDGFTGTGFVCEDIDECALGTDDCDVNALCADTEGSFTCTCNEGFTGDGKTCTGVLGYGDPCTDPVQCASGLCISAPYNHCSELCNQAVANDCPDVGASGFCVPIGGDEFACVGELSLGVDDDEAIVSPGDSVTRSLNTLTDADLFQVPVTDGMFELVATPVGSHDVQLEVYDSIGQPIGTINDGGPGAVEGATLTTTGGAGVIFCIVRNAGTTTGSYTFSVTAL